MNGTVFDIQKFSINDGPGIRTNVFMKGCPLRCIWCHNPESKSARKEMLFRSEKCIGCGACLAVCDKNAHTVEEGVHIYDREKCTLCAKCADACLYSALETVGKQMTVEEVIAEVMKDKVFYDNSGGGITVSGGEPMMQLDFTYALLKAAKEKGLHVCMETCGYAKPEHYKLIAPLVDIFLFDYKESDPTRHKEYTGVTNELILENLIMLDSMGAKTVLRCPIIPTLNDRDDHLEGIARMANSLSHVLEINVEPYHPLGAGKSEALGKDYPLKDIGFMDDSRVNAIIQRIAALTKVPVKKA